MKFKSPNIGVSVKSSFLSKDLLLPLSSASSWDHHFQIFLSDLEQLEASETRIEAGNAPSRSGGDLRLQGWTDRDVDGEDGAFHAGLAGEGRRGEDVVEGGYQAVALQGRWQQEDV